MMEPLPTEPFAPPDLAAKRRRAEGILRPFERVVVALSGGVDSAALLAVSREALGPEGVLAVTGRSDAVTGEDVADAEGAARALGVDHLVVRTREIERDGYRANDGLRCFHCRTELFHLLRGIARDRGFRAVAYGAIADDLGDVRPGMEAARAMGVLAPLLDAGFRKDDARAVAREAGLQVADKPASPCLASRIPVGTEVTAERLDQVRRAESGLKRLGFAIFRVRHHGEIARLELDEAEAARLLDPAVRSRAVAALREAGFRYAALDLEGYRRSGGAGPAPEPLYGIGPKRDGGQ